MRRIITSSRFPETRLNKYLISGAISSRPAVRLALVPGNAKIRHLRQEEAAYLIRLWRFRVNNGTGVRY